MREKILVLLKCAREQMAAGQLTDHQVRALSDVIESLEEALMVFEW